MVFNLSRRNLSELIFLKWKWVVINLSAPEKKKDEIEEPMGSELLKIDYNCCRW
jgi:hypothetical protein